MPKKGPTGDETPRAAFCVLDDITLATSRAYVQMLERLNTAIAGVLKKAGETQKSDGLLEIDGVSKAYPLGGAAAGVVRPDVVGAGARGGKWWRDKHGHVRYGEKPGKGGGDERDWEEVPEGDVQKIHESMEAAYEYSPALRDKLVSVLGELGISPESLLDVIHAAKSYGESTEQFFINSVVASGGSEDEASKAFSKIIGATRDALQDEELKAAVHAAVEKRSMVERELSADLDRTSEYTTGWIKELMTGNVSPVAMRLLGLMSDLKMLYIPSGIKEVGGNRAEAMGKLGRIIPHHTRLEIMRGFLDKLTPEQLAALFVAERFSEIEKSYDPEAASKISFKDPETGEFSETELDQRKESLFRFLRDAFEGDLGRRISSAEYTKNVKRLNEVGHFVNSYLQDFNNDRGGEAVGLVFGGQYPARKLFENESSVEFLENLVQTRRTLIKDALAAQQNGDFKTPDVMVPGFLALSEELQAKGVLPPGKETGILEYQRQLLNWMGVVKRGVIAFDVGLGKTVAAIAEVARLLAEKKEKRGIIVLPKGLAKQWPEQIDKFFPGANVQMFSEKMGLDDRLEMLEAIQKGDIPCDFLIMSSSTLTMSKSSRAALHKSGVVQEVKDDQGQSMWIRKPGVSDYEYIDTMRTIAATDPLAAALKNLSGIVFYDEAHSEMLGLKDPNNIHNVVAREMLKDRERAFLMTATPMPNGRPEELFNLMDLVHPGSAGPDVKRFANKIARYEPVVDEQTGSVDLVQVADDNWEQASRDVAPFVFTKKKNEPSVRAANDAVGLRIPNLITKTHTLEMPPEIAKLAEKAGDIQPHDTMEHQWVPARRLSDAGKMLRKIHQLQQLAITPKLLLGDEYTGPQPKIEHVVDLVKAHFNEGGNADKPIVIASMWPSAFKYIKQALVGANVDPSLIGQIDGTVSPDDRDLTQEAVNAGNIKVLLLGMQAGGAGLNLQKKANKVICLEEPWSPHHKEQTVGRVARPGRENPDDPVTLINLHMQGSIDDDKVLGMKDKLATCVTMSMAKDGGDVAQKAVMASIIDMLGGLKALEHKKPEEIASELEALGLSGLVTPDVLKTHFNKEQFNNTVEFKRYLKYESRRISSYRALNLARFKNGKLSHAQYTKETKRLDEQERQHQTALRDAGKVKLAVPVDFGPKQPERQFVLVANEAPKESVLTETAKTIMGVMQRHNGAITASDFMHDYYRPTLLQNAKTPEEHDALSAQWWKYHDNIEGEVKQGFKELQRLGVVGVKHSEVAANSPKTSHMPLPNVHPESPSTHAEEMAVRKGN